MRIMGDKKNEDRYKEKDKYKYHPKLNKRGK